jgi:hypothetical protein
MLRVQVGYRFSNRASSADVLSNGHMGVSLQAATALDYVNAQRDPQRQSRE